MILQFSVSNYRCFKERATLSLIASNYDKSTRENENIIANEKQKIRLLKSAVIYGANASGKSKFIEAMMFMRHYVLSSNQSIPSPSDLILTVKKLVVNSKLCFLLRIIYIDMVLRLIIKK